MILFNKELGEKDCSLNPDVNTNKYLLAFFGFYKHHIKDDFNSFLKEVGVEKTGYIDLKNEFKLNGSYALEAYNVCDRRTFDITLILPKTFENEAEAIDWFNNKLKESDYMKKSEISEIGVLDADKLLNFIEEELSYSKKVDEISKDVENKIKEFKQTLFIELNNKYNNDSTYKDIIKNTIKSKFLCLFID